MPLSGLFPLRDVDGRIPLDSKNHGRTGVGIATPGHYEE